MVSSSENYKASLVRLAGNRPECVTPVPSALDGQRYGGRQQVARAGSCVIVEDAGRLQSLARVSVCAWVWPTRPRQGRTQVLINGGAWSLSIDRFGAVGFGVATDATIAELQATRPITERAWTFLCGSYDADTGRAALYCQERGPYAPPAETIERSLRPALLKRGAPAVYLAAASRAPAGSATWGEAHFDGKLEAPTVYGRVLDASELARIFSAAGDAAYPEDGLVAAWRFEHGMAGNEIVDAGPSARHGRAVNSPARAMTGHAWRASTSDPATAPHEYGAIHFHADDLEDTEWHSDFELRVPDTLRSGIYAIRLTSPKGADKVPFVVRPPRKSTTSKVALLLPTLTYLAYANEKLPDASSFAGYRMSGQSKVSVWDAWLASHPELGMSLYDSHADGSGCCYSSRLRPIPSLRPDYVSSQLWFPRHLAADLLLVEWFARTGFEVDLLTDEDVDDGGAALLSDYRVVVTGSHPEYVTERILDALEGYVSQGGRLMYLGGNGFFWVTSIKEPGRHLIEVRRGQTNQLPWDSSPGELHHSTTGELGGLWELRGRPPRGLAGVGFAAMGMRARPYMRTTASHDPRYAWVFEGIADDDVIGGGGEILGAAGGYEIDRCDPRLGSPAGTVVLAQANGLDLEYELFTPGSHFAKPPLGEPPYARADMTLLETANGGAVFSVGSMAWVGSLLSHGGDNPVSTLTRNVLTGFLTRAVSTRQPE